MISDSNTTLLLVIPPVLGLLWSVKEYTALAAIKLDGHQGMLLSNTQGGKKSLEMMIHIAKLISDGASTFLFQEYVYMIVYIFLFSFVLYFYVGMGTVVAFIVGALTSILCGWIGMRAAVFTNVRTAHEAWKDLESGYNAAIRGGTVMGLSLVSFGVLNLFACIYMFSQKEYYGENTKELYEALAGYGLGGSSIALFGRVGGGIYTKAADVGADLSGKNSYGMNEDDVRNPACLADNVGDNVGDIAGMGADLFGSFAEASCAALVIAGSSASFLVDGKIRENHHNITQNFGAMMYPVLISSVGIIVGIITVLVVPLFYKVKDLADIEKALKGVLIISTIIASGAILYLSWWTLPEEFTLDAQTTTTNTNCAISCLVGCWSGLIIGIVTEYYTSHSYEPTRSISRTQVTSAATGIIMGLAVGYLSVIIPVFCLAITVLVAHTLAGTYGIALGALGMLSTMTMGLTIDAYGPISDNAGGIAEMAELGEEVRKRTDALDAAGNTTAAIGKGFAIGSAALVSLALQGAFCVRAEIAAVNVMEPWTFAGLLVGAMIPYAFGALTMMSVSKAADEMVVECLTQFPKILDPVNPMKPDYKRCIQIATEASLKEMIAPGAIVLLSPIVSGLLFGKNTCSGLLIGSMVSGVQLAISMSNTGGAWDNSKKYIEAGGIPGHAKRSECHKNAVVGDTVGDPLKDTSGPALNIVMKLQAVVALVFGTAIMEHSNAKGGPYWL